MKSPVGVLDARLLGSTGRLLAVGADTAAHVWEVESETELHRLRGVNVAYKGVAVRYFAAGSADGRYVASASNSDTMVWLYNAATGEPVTRFDGIGMYAPGSRPLFPEAIHPDSRSILTSRSWFVREWDLDSEELLQEIGPTILAHRVIISMFSPDGKQIATVSANNGTTTGVVHLWDAQTGTRLFEYDLETYTYDMAFSRDGSRLFVSTQREEVIVIDCVNHSLLRVIKLPRDRIAFRLIPSINGGLLYPLLTFGVQSGVYSTVTGRVVNTPSYIESIPTSATYTPDGTILMIGYQNGVVRAYHAYSSLPVDSLQGHTGPVNSISFSDDGSRMITGSADSTIVVWRRANLGVGEAAESSSSELSIVGGADGGTLIRYRIETGGEGDLQVFDLTGREVDLESATQPVSGAGTLSIPSDALHSGVYLVVLNVPGRGRQIRRMLVR